MFLINVIPFITTLTMIYEWEAIVLIIQEQKNDTMGETLDKLKNNKNKKKFKKKE